MTAVRLKRFARPLYSSMTHVGGSGSAAKLTLKPRLFVQRHSHVGP